MFFVLCWKINLLLRTLRYTHDNEFHEWIWQIHFVNVCTSMKIIKMNKEPE